MKYGGGVSTAGEYANPEILADLAAEAEKAGWDGFFIGDIIFSENEPNVPGLAPGWSWLLLRQRPAASK